jgi:predicted enzyme related to lactoylglutathione lyase
LLGLKPGLEIEFAPGQWWIEYDVAGQALAISNAMPGAPSSSLTLEVASLDDSLAAVRAAGVTVAFEVMEFPPCRIFGIKDPDGNQIGLHQRKAQA